MQRPSPTFMHFPWKMIAIGLQTYIMSVLNYSQIANFLFIFLWTLKQLLSNSQLYLIFIGTYNQHLFTIILKIHIFAIFRCFTDVLLHLFCLGIKIVKQFLFFFFYSNILLKYLYIWTLLLLLLLLLFFANVIS